MKSVSIRNVLIVLLACVLGLGGLAYCARGMHWAWQGDDCDLKSRGEEYRDFSKQIYPNLRVKQTDKPRASAHTVYPPYALPIFTVFFGNWSYEVARAILQVLSVAALLLMMWLGASVLWKYGAASAVLGASLPLAFSGNRVAMAAGQFSILCMGLIALQVVFQTRGHAVPAGVCWACAMIKPQIALPFALLFLTNRQWRGLLAGGGLLLFLSLAALWWTGLGPLDFMTSGPASEKLRFVQEYQYSAGLWIEALNITPRVATAAALAFLASLTLLFVSVDFQKLLPLLPASAVCATLGFTLFYHREYDNIMLYPLLLALVERLYRTSCKIPDALVTALLAVTVFLPIAIVWLSGWLMFLSFIMPAAAVLVLLVRQFGEGFPRSRPS